MQVKTNQSRSRQITLASDFKISNGFSTSTNHQPNSSARGLLPTQSSTPNDYRTLKAIQVN